MNRTKENKEQQRITKLWLWCRLIQDFFKVFHQISLLCSSEWPSLSLISISLPQRGSTELSDGSVDVCVISEGSFLCFFSFHPVLLIMVTVSFDKHINSISSWKVLVPHLLLVSPGINEVPGIIFILIPAPFICYLSCLAFVEDAAGDSPADLGEAEDADATQFSKVTGYFTCWCGFLQDGLLALSHPYSEFPIPVLLFHYLIKCFYINMHHL